MKRQLPRQTLETQFLSPHTRQAPLSETIRLGTQLMLQKAVELEVTEFLRRDHCQRRGDSLLRGYRNGYADRRVQTAEGPIHLRMPQVCNTIDAFETVWLQSLVRRSDKMAEFIPQLYVKGMSTRDIEAQAVLAMCEREYPEAMKCLGADLEECLTALRFPETHLKRIRTTKLLERLFGEGQRRAKVIPRFVNERSGLSLMFAVLVDASASWRGLKASPAIVEQLDALMTDSLAKQVVLVAA